MTSDLAKEPNYSKEGEHTKKLPDSPVGTMFIVKNMETLLWAKLKSGDTTALGDLYDIYVDVLYSFGIHQTQDKGYVMDCIHDLFFDLHKYRSKLAMTDNVKYYLFKSLKRKINRKYSKKVISFSTYFQGSINEIDKRYTKSHEESIILAELASEKSFKLSVALGALTEKQKKGLYLRYNQEMSYVEIAEAMGISVESSRTTVYRAIKAMRNYQFQL
jgi:RNA polymerase sigma factor (sigma-70 family)